MTSVTSLIDQFTYQIVSVKSYSLRSCYHRDVLTTVMEDYGVDLSKCQVVLLSQPDMLPDFNCPATNFANQSFLIIASLRHLSVALRPEAVSITI